MDSRYYEILRNASQEDFYQAINNPEDELYDILWDLFETVVIEPAEVFNPQFRDSNQFRYSIDSGITLEFFPSAEYFQKRREPDPYKDNSDAAGIHLKLSILPYMSCLFSLGFQVWGRTERLAFKRLWQRHRGLFTGLFRRAKPMICTAVPFPTVDHASTVEEMLDNYFALRDPENFLELQYSFAEFDQTDTAQDFMVFMAVLYHAIKEICQKKTNPIEDLVERMREFYSGHPPDLPPPLPCVAMTITSDTE